MKHPAVAPWRKPAALHLQDPVALIAPSGPLPEERVLRGMAQLAQRYMPVRAAGLFDRQGFLAGSDGRRLAELRWALADPAVRAIFCGRGGYGLLRYVAALCELPATEISPRPVVGFSDITVLHAFLALRRQVAIHGPVVSQLDELGAEDLEALWTLLEDPAAPPPLEGLVALLGEKHPVEGRLLGGNLEVLSRLVGTPLHAALLPGEPVVLLLEEVSEVPYRIDRALTQLLLSGMLREVRAIIVGDLVRCQSATGDGPTALEVLVERTAKLGVPVLAEVPVGHGTRNRPLPLGTWVTVEPRQRRVIFREGAVVGA